MDIKGKVINDEDDDEEKEKREMLVKMSQNKPSEEGGEE
jgi:hypothetical protein